MKESCGVRYLTEKDSKLYVEYNYVYKCFVDIFGDDIELIKEYHEYDAYCAAFGFYFRHKKTGVINNPDMLRKFFWE